MRTLRRPGGYIAALIVVTVALASGLPWWASAAIAVLAFIVGTGIATALVRRSAGGMRTTTLTQPVVIETTSATFRLEGEYWTLAFRGPAFRIHDTKGLRYIHHLLGTPGVEVHALDLILLGQTAAVVTTAREDDLHLDAPSEQPLLDREAVRRYRGKIEDLRDQIEEAEANNDPERGARAREELELILDQIDRDSRRDGTPRNQAGEAERARLNVTRAIKSAISRVRDQDASLGHHLDHNIRTGTYCCYEPDAASPLTWAL